MSGRLCWTAKDSRLIFAPLIETLDKRIADIDAGKPGFDASKIIETDIDANPVPFIAVIDLRHSLNAWLKAMLPALIKKAAFDETLQEALKVLGEKNDLFKMLPPASITVARPSAGAFELKIRAPCPSLGIAAVVLGLTSAVADAQAAPAPGPEGEAPEIGPTK